MDHPILSELVPGCSMCLRKALPSFERLVHDAWPAFTLPGLSWQLTSPVVGCCCVQSFSATALWYE